MLLTIIYNIIILIEPLEKMIGWYMLISIILQGRHMDQVEIFDLRFVSNAVRNIPAVSILEDSESLCWNFRHKWGSSEIKAEAP